MQPLNSVLVHCLNTPSSAKGCAFCAPVPTLLCEVAHILLDILSAKGVLTAKPRLHHTRTHTHTHKRLMLMPNSHLAQVVSHGPAHTACTPCSSLVPTQAYPGACVHAHVCGAEVQYINWACVCACMRACAHVGVCTCVCAGT